MVKAKSKGGAIFEIDDCQRLLGGDGKVKQAHKFATSTEIPIWEGHVADVVFERMQMLLPDELELIERVDPPSEGDVY